MLAQQVLLFLQDKGVDRSAKDITNSDSRNIQFSKYFIIKADEVSIDGMKHEESTQDSVSYGAHPEWASEEIHLSNTSDKEMVPEIIPPAENEHKNESFFTGTLWKNIILLIPKSCYTISYKNCNLDFTQAKMTWVCPL